MIGQEGKVLMQEAKKVSRPLQGNVQGLNLHSADNSQNSKDPSHSHLLLRVINKPNNLRDVTTVNCNFEIRECS